MLKLDYPKYSSFLKQVFLIALFCALSLAGNGQNMVPNGNFEQYTICPANVSAVPNCTGWAEYTPTPDYFNTCNTVLGTVGVPTNFFGYQAAASGNGYDGFAIVFNLRESITRPITPLVIGGTYEVSMSASLAEVSMYGVNALGVYFFDNGSTSVSSANLLSITPQISYSVYGPISDKTNWVRLTGVFTADSAYDNLAITGFGPTTSFIIDTLSGTYAYAYYYIDSVVVRLANHIIMGNTDTLICAGDSVHIAFTTIPSNYYNTNNLFTLQLSNSVGSFTTPVNIGTLTGGSGGTINGVIPIGILPGTGYRLRIVANSPGDTSRNSRSIAISNLRPDKPIAGNSGPICAGTTLSLTATTATSGVNWKWNGPNGFTSTLQNPVIASAQGVSSGSYVVSAYIGVCQSKDTTNAGVSTGSVIEIAHSNSPVCDNDTLKLSCSGNGSAISYSWIGPNSFTSSLQNPKIIDPTSSAAGNYYLNVTLAGCTILDTVPVLVKPTPVGLTASSNNPLCIGDTMKLYSGSTTTGVTYLWNGPNGYSTFTQNPVLPNAGAINAGNYIITYLLNGCSVKDTMAVAVNPVPLPVIANSSSPVCAGTILNLTSASATTGVSYNWTGPNSFTSSTQNPNITNAATTASGDYVVTASLANCSAKDTITTLVKPLPANINATNNSPLCVGGTLNLSASSSSTGLSYSWTGPNSYSSSAQNPAIANTQVAATGDYIITFTLNGCTAKDTTTAAVYPIPAKPSANHNTPICTGETLLLTASTIAGATYNWSGPAFSAASQNPSVPNLQPVGAGAYVVSTTVNGCTSANDTTIVVVNPSPVVNIYPSPNDTICLGNNVTFVATISGGGTTPLYQWVKNNINIGSANGVSYSSAGIANNDVITCKLTNNTTCFSAQTDTSNTIKMTVLPWQAPSATIVANPGGPVSPWTLVTFTATAVNAGTNPSYQWKRNGQDIIGATSYTWGSAQLSDMDTICCVVTSSYICAQPLSAMSNCIPERILTGIKTVSKDPIRIYPNPVNNELIIESAALHAAVQITDLLGRVVYRGIINSVKQSINTSALVSGTYVLQVTPVNGRREMFKVVKE